jgi:hypothetical protein
MQICRKSSKNKDITVIDTVKRVVIGAKTSEDAIEAVKNSCGGGDNKNLVNPPTMDVINVEKTVTGNPATGK